MRPQEIRDKGLMPEGDLFDDQATTLAPTNSLLWICAGFLREIAAQLAELKEEMVRTRLRSEGEE